MAKKKHDGRLPIRNRDTYRAFVPSPVEEYRSTERIVSTEFVRNSPDRKYEELKAKGLQIDIRNPEIYVNGKKPIDGIFSPLFGADATEDTPIYTCDCHNLTGGANVGRICPDCQSVVRSIEADLRMAGHIDIAPYHILTFHGYAAMSKILKNLDEILTTPLRIGRSGHIAKREIPTILDLYDDYEELYQDRIGLDKDIVFMSKIPVYSARLRPLLKFNYRINELPVNMFYKSITKLSGILRIAQFLPNHLSREVEVQTTLNKIQSDFNEVCNIVKSQIDHKTGVFRRALASGRVDGSSRMVITLGIDLMPHEIDVPYQLMMIQYEEEIANYLARLRDIPLAKAISLVEDHVMIPTPLFVEIINQILKSGYGIWVLVNRNPTISEYGIQYSRIRKIHDDFNDITLHLPQDVLEMLGADFDGDVVSTVSVKNPKYHRFFISMAPTYAFIDRADGRFNRAMGFKKDYAALISYAWDVDTAYDRYLTHWDEESYNTLKAMGLDDVDDVNAKAKRKRRDELLAKLATSTVDESYKYRYGGPYWELFKDRGTGD